MKLKFFNLFLVLVNLSLVRLETETETENTDLEVKSELDPQTGLRLTYEAINVLINGEPKENSYKDLFIDTSKSIFDQVDKGNDMVTIDDMLRIFFQSVIILVGSRRPDIIPDDFNERHVAYGTFISELSKILETLLNKGTGSVTLKDLRLILKTVRSDEFWDSVGKLKQEIDAEIVKEEEAELAKLKAKQKEKEEKKQEL